MVIQQRDRDYTEFDIQANLWKEKFSKHCQSAVEKHNDAIGYIDDTIRKLEKIKAELQGSNKQLTLASGDFDDLTVKKLAKNSPSILAQVKNQIDESKPSKAKKTTA